MYNFDVDPEPVVASQESDSLSVVSPHQQRRWRAGTTGSIARHAPASWTYTSWLLYKEATFVMVQSVLVSKERLFRYQRQTYRAVQCRLQEY